MDDKRFTLFAVVVAIALFAWYWWTRKHAQSGQPAGVVSGAFPQSLNLPTPNPQAYLPPTIGKLEMNIQNPGLNMLSNQYIPLFGFTGMAQGTYYS